MKVYIKNTIQPLFLFVLFSSIISCNNWEEKDIEKYKAECKRAKIEAAFCDCSLEKIQASYQSFDDFMKHEEDFIEIIKTCKEEKQP